ncbi:MAG TPA: hypothetical protein ENI27_03710 [bacterium]|nr:hypothetical protein [bacterium]
MKSVRVKVNGRLFIVPVEPTAANIRRCVEVEEGVEVKYCETWKLKSLKGKPTWKKLTDGNTLHILGLTEFIVDEPTKPKKEADGLLALDKEH